MGNKKTFLQFLTGKEIGMTLMFLFMSIVGLIYWNDIADNSHWVVPILWQCLMIATPTTYIIDRYKTYKKYVD